MSISIRRSTREHHMILQTHFTIPNVSWCSFFIFHTPSGQVSTAMILSSPKRDFGRASLSPLSGVKNFSSGHQYPTCVFAVFVRIISINKSKREHCMILPSRLMTANVNSEWFFKVDAPWGYGLPLRVFKMWRKWVKIGSEQVCYAPRNFSDLVDNV